MHLGNGAVTAECAIAAAGVAAAGLGFSLVCLRKGQQNRSLATAGLLAASVLAAQMVNVPVGPFSSAHLVGGVLLAWILGPALGALCMAAVLCAQALMMGDGGLATLGVNIINMALVPAGLTAMVRRFTGKQSANAALCALTAAAAVMIAAVLIVFETALFRAPAELAGWTQFAQLMLLSHLPVGLLEGAATGILVVLLVGKQSSAPLDNSRLGRMPWRAALSLAVVVLALAAPLASSLPDGYEAAAEQSGQTSWLSADRAVIAAAGQLNAFAHDVQQQATALCDALLIAETPLILAAAIVAGLAAAGAAASFRYAGFTNPRRRAEL